MLKYFCAILAMLNLSGCAYLTNKENTNDKYVKIIELIKVRDLDSAKKELSKLTGKNEQYVQILKGEIFLIQGNEEEYFELVEKCKKGSNKLLRDYCVISQAHLYASQGNDKNKKMRKSALLYNRIERGSLLFPEARIGLAWLFLRANRYSEIPKMLEPFTRGYDNSPHQKEAYMIISFAYLLAKDYEKAIMNLEHAMNVKIKNNYMNNIDLFGENKMDAFAEHMLCIAEWLKAKEHGSDQKFQCPIEELRKIGVEVSSKRRVPLGRHWLKWPQDYFSVNLFYLTLILEK